MISSIKEDKFLIFNLRTEDFGIPIIQIKEVFQPDKILKLPRVSPILSGIVNLRGKLISVFDPAVILWGNNISGSSMEIELIPTILLVTLKNYEYGVLVGNIPHIVEIKDFNEKDSKYIEKKGIINFSAISKVGLLDVKKEILLLDLNSLLNPYIILEEDDKGKTEEKDDIDLNQFTLKEEEEIEGDKNFDIDQYTLPDDNDYKNRK